MIKRLLSAICIILLAFSLSACGPDSSSDDNSWKDKNVNEMTGSEKEKASDYVNKMFEGSSGF